MPKPRDLDDAPRRIEPRKDPAGAAGDEHTELLELRELMLTLLTDIGHRVEEVERRLSLAQGNAAAARARKDDSVT